MSLTIIQLPEHECEITLPAGTIVYAANREQVLGEDLTVIIESRGATNHDNRRRAIHPQTRQHWFWVQGQDVISRLTPAEILKIANKEYTG